MTNPLLDFSSLPLFDRITPADVEPAITQLLEKADVALAQVTQDDFPADLGHISKVLDTATEQLGRAWGCGEPLPICGRHARTSGSLQRPTSQSHRVLDSLGCNEALYAKYKAIRPDSLNPEQNHARTLALRNFVLSGAELAGADKVRFSAIQELQAEISQLFS